MIYIILLLLCAVSFFIGYLISNKKYTKKYDNYVNSNRIHNRQSMENSFYTLKWLQSFISDDYKRLKEKEAFIASSPKQIDERIADCQEAIEKLQKSIIDTKKDWETWLENDDI